MSRIKSYRNDNNTLTRGAVPLVVTLMSIPLVGILALPSNTFAEGSSTDSSVDELVVTVPVFCTLTSTGNDSHNAEIDGGTYRADIGTTTIKAICNDNEGFSIYATGYTGNEIGTENSNKLVSGTNTIITGTSTGPVSGNDTSNWAMKLSTTSSPTPAYPITIESDTEGTFSNYHTVPNTYTKVATRASSTDVGDEAIGSTFTTTYATYISGTQAPGTYTGQVKYTLVHPATEEPLQPQPATQGCINYFANASDAVGTMGCQDMREIDWSSCYDTDYNSYCYDEDWNDIDIETLPRLNSYQTNQTLLASNFSRNGYGFAGWSDSFDYATNPNAKFYGPQETVVFSEDTLASGLSLYAVWIKSQGSIQDQSKVASVCNSLITAPTDGTASLTSVSALTDQRDNNTYAIAKLADGKCWMIENLRLESTAEHNSDGTLAQGYGTSATYGNFGGLADAENSGFPDTYTANSLYYSGTQEGTASINIGTTNYPGRRMPRYNNWNNQSNSTNRPQNPTTNSAINSTTNAGMYSYGNYYTWHAAMANTTYYVIPTATDADGKTSETVNTSLCPTGWRLPYGRDTGNGTTIGGFYNLNYKINNDSNVTDSTASRKLRAFPNNFLYSGYFGTSAGNRGSFGYYWSSTAGNYLGSYSLYLGSSNVGPGTLNSNKVNGLSIRCTVSAGT